MRNIPRLLVFMYTESFLSTELADAFVLSELTRILCLSLNNSLRGTSKGSCTNCRIAAQLRDCEVVEQVEGTGCAGEEEPHNERVNFGRCRFSLWDQIGNFVGDSP